MVILRPVWMTNLLPSVLWHCWLGHQTCKNRRPYNLDCVGADVKPCSINQSSKVIDLGVNGKPIRDFLFVIVILAVSATVFEIFRLKHRKLLILPTPPLFDTPARGNPLECRDEIWLQKNRIVGLPDGEEIMTLALFILTQYRRMTDRQTAGQTRCCRKDPR